MNVVYALVIFVPIAIVLHFTGIGGDVAVFVTSAIALVPLAALLGRATDETATYTGPQIGALLNATLGNAAELIITIAALRQGFVHVVKASIAGSIIGNILIVLGASMLFGGLKHGTQRFDAQAARTSSTMMALAVLALVIPAVFALGEAAHRPSERDIAWLSDGLAIVLIVIYLLYLLFSLRRPSVAPVDRRRRRRRGESAHQEHGPPTMALKWAMALLTVSTLAIVFMSELLIGALEPTVKQWGLSEMFVGVMLIPLVGNTAEHLVAVQAAIDDKMDLAMGIAIGSGLQIALFVTPVLVWTGLLVGRRMTLVFNSFELIALVAASVTAVLISVDGESNWLEGAILLALAVMLGIAFFVVP